MRLPWCLLHSVLAECFPNFTWTINVSHFSILSWAKLQKKIDNSQCNQMESVNYFYFTSGGLFYNHIRHYLLGRTVNLSEGNIHNIS